MLDKHGFGKFDDQELLGLVSVELPSDVKAALGAAYEHEINNVPKAILSLLKD